MQSWPEDLERAKATTLGYTSLCLDLPVLLSQRETKLGPNSLVQLLVQPKLNIIEMN